MAAAAWSCVEKMLQLTQRTSAPRATSVSMSTAVCTVMCNDPAMRAPASGCSSMYLRKAISPGISCSASGSCAEPSEFDVRLVVVKGQHPEHDQHDSPQLDRES